MNTQEAKRYAHMIASVAITERIERISAGPDRDKIIKAMRAMSETHARFGPRQSDRPPREPEYKGEPLAFDAPDGEDGDAICRCNDRLPHAPGDASEDGTPCSATS